MERSVFKGIMDISKLMLEAGAEIYRVEESIGYMCRGYGADDAQIYATTSNIIVTLDMGREPQTRTCRIGRISTDINRVEQLNALSRYIFENAPDGQYINDQIELILSSKTYRNDVVILFYGVIAAVFCLFFGSRSVAEVAVSFFIGICVGALSLFLDGRISNRLFLRFTCSFCSSFLAHVFLSLSIVGRIDYIVIGNIMALIPGIGLTNSLRDLFTGDNISGILRFIEAILLALSIALGYVAASLIFGGAVR